MQKLVMKIEFQVQLYLITLFSEDEICERVGTQALS